MLKHLKSFIIVFLVANIIPEYVSAEKVDNTTRKVAGFTCINLQPLRNDDTFDLYEWGGWSFAGFSQDIWKRHGVPFWYPRGTGSVSVTGKKDGLKVSEVIIPLDGIIAKELFCLGNVGTGFDTSPGIETLVGEYVLCYENGLEEAIPLIIGKNVAHIRFGNFVPEAVNAFSFVEKGLGASEATASINQGAEIRIGATAFSTGFEGRIDDLRIYEHELSEEEITAMINPHEVNPLAADDVMEVKKPAVWYEFENDAKDSLGKYNGTFQGDAQIVIDTERSSVLELSHGQFMNAPYAMPKTNTTTVLWFKTQKGGGLFGSALGGGQDKDIDVGRNGSHDIESFVWHGSASFVKTRDKDYLDGKWHHVARTIGPNGHRLYVDGILLKNELEGQLFYHLDEMVNIEPKRQLMKFDYTLAHPDLPLKELKFRCTNPQATLHLAAVAFRQSGQCLNILKYNGRMIKPYPQDTPTAKPSPVEARLDKSRRLLLDGKWQYLTDPGNQGVRRGYYAETYDTSSWNKMLVPSQWYVQGVDYHGVVWFRNEFVVPVSFPGSIMELNFERVDYDARVWVNGQFIGRHIGAYSSFKFDVTESIKKGDKNLVVVRVDSPLDPGKSGPKTIIKGNVMDDIPIPYDEEGCMGGIYRSVTLVGRGNVGIENVWTVSEVSKDLTHADVTVKLDLNPVGTFNENVLLKCSLIEPATGKNQGRVFNISKDITPSGITPVELTISIDNPKLWWVWEQGTPNLHFMEIEVWQDKTLLDKHISRVGIRQIGAYNKQYYTLNHHRIFLKGMLNDGLHWQSLMDRTGYRQRVQLQKDANLNVIRLIGHQESSDFYDLCDEMGMLVWQELPLQWVYSSSEVVRKDILMVGKNTIIQCRPHASVFGWTAWNEGGQVGFSEKLVAMIKELDSSRPYWQASGGTGWGDTDGWNIHIYPNLSFNLSRRTPLWSGIKTGFISEIGGYGLTSIEEMKEILGDDILPFDSAEYYWDIFNTYRTVDGPVFNEPPVSPGADATKEQICDYIRSKAEPSQRWLAQFLKYFYENFRGQLFAPASGAIHCRFDCPFPSGYFGGVVSFNGKPRKAYYSVQQACQQVLPIMFFDYTGVEDIRVVNEYWHKGWKECTLKYLLKTRDGKIILRKDKRFDLPSDSVVKVLSRQEAGDVWHLPGFFAELAVLDSKGNILSANFYDMTNEDIQTFITSVYPLPPVRPIDSVMLMASDAVESQGVTRRIKNTGKTPIFGPFNAMASMLAEHWYEPIGTYSDELLELGGDEQKPYLKYAITVPQTGKYLIRVSCESGIMIRQFELLVDGKKAMLEEFGGIDMTRGLSRVSYFGDQNKAGNYDLTGSGGGLSWRPGWEVQLSKGEHILEFKWPDERDAPTCIVDAICLQKKGQK